MTTTEVLSHLNSAGLTCTLSGFADPALLVSPRSALTPELRALVAAHRDELVDVLYAARADAEWPPVPTDTPAQLWACSPWPGGAPELLPSTSHYVFVDDSEGLPL